MISHRELMALHVEALFTHDNAGGLVRANEPDGGPAPRFFIGTTLDSSVLRFRYDVPSNVRQELEAAAEDDVHRQPLDAPISSSRYEAILARSAPVQRRWAGPAFSFPDELPSALDAILVTETNAHLLQPLLAGWIHDVPRCQPMYALAVDGGAVAVCCSVRTTVEAHEAGVETVPAFRGRGHAARVVTAWARAVRELNRIPFYSTSWQNGASRTVARKLGLIHFGSDLHIE
jgi:RimJ/RimL family protein N-acetyltransferase